ncbi:MAG: hypothetical protein COB09_19170 [Thalassobium sp.]|nr:MAG: hypothetical protein COB09_19170 [Thalassobium sp.]
MSATLNGWQNVITISVITQTLVDGLTVNSFVDTSFRGTIQPLKAEHVQLKPEGQRSWQWLQIHAVAGDLNLKNDDRIIYRDIKYKVMANKDYSLNGFIEYEIVKDYT